METSLLTTKLVIPPARPSLVARPRLTKRLEGALNCCLTLVSAPAGFGKTTVLSQWAQQSKDRCRIGWVSLDERDDDPVRFWQYFAASLKSHTPDGGESTSKATQFSKREPTESALTGLINEVNTTPESFVIVLDDYHLIKSEAVHAGMTFLFEHVPHNLHIVIATRADPPLPLAHYRGRGMLLEIGVDDLRFTLEEATALLQGLQDSELAADEVNALNIKAEGWAAGLKLAALSLGQRGNAKSFIERFSGNQRYVMDYLVEEVLKQQPEEIRSFLLTTSVLDRLSAPLCDSITEHNSSQEILVKLESSFGGFLVPLDESRQWYRYHHLFAELLCYQAETVLGAQEINLLHERASQWYRGHGFVDDAVHHALAARDWERAVTLVGSVAESLNKQGNRATLLTWLQAIPEERVRANPKLYGHYTFALLFFGNLEKAEAALSYLDRIAKGDANLQGEVAALQTMRETRRNNIPRVIEVAKSALSLLAPENFFYRSWATYMIGYAQYFRGNIDESWAWHDEALKLAQQAGDYHVIANSLHYQACITRQRGNLHRSQDTANRAIEAAGQTPPAASPHLALSAILYEWNDLEASTEHARLAVRWSEIGGNTEARAVGYLYLAQTRLIQNDSAGAAEAIGQAYEIAHRPTNAPFSKARHDVGRVMLAIRQNDLETAGKWGKRLPDYGENLPFEFRYVPARLLIAQGKKEAAAEQLHSVYERAARVDAQGIIIAIRVCQALAAATPAEALSFLTEALVKAEPEGYIRTFADEGKLLAPVLRRALAQGITPEYTTKLLSIIGAEERRRRTTAGQNATRRLVEPVSEREIEILRLVEVGLSNRQIAGKLFVTEGTVKAHIYNVMEKLNARNRTQAVTRARELNLL